MALKFFKVFNFNEDFRIRINQFIIDNNGTPFHEIEFNEIVSKEYGTLFYYLVAKENSNIIGACPIHQINKGFLKFLYSSLNRHEIPYGGWIYNEKKININLLISKLRLPFLSKLIYSSNIQLNENRFRVDNFSKVKIRKTVIINLNRSEDELFSSLNSKQRNKIRRSERKGVTIEKIPLNNIREFYLLSNELKNNIDIDIKSNGIYSKILEVYLEKGKAICMAAKYDNEYISSMIFIANENFSIGWVAGRKVNIPNNLYQNELLLWNLILWSNKAGSRVLDLCGLDEVNLPHLARMKLSFSKDVKKFYSFSKSSFVFKIINNIQNRIFKIKT